MRTLMTIFAHQDDETFSAGGVLTKYSKLSKTWAVSVTKDSRRVNEFEDACKLLGTKPVLLENENLVDTLTIHQQLIGLLRKYKPDIVITHLEYDYHSDHRVVNSLVKEAVEWASHTTSDAKAFQVDSLWAAETTILIPFPEILIDISEENEVRLSAIKCYDSQRGKGGAGFYSKFHNTRAILRGIQANVSHAEAFVSIPIVKAGSFKPVKVLKEFPS